MDSRRGRAVYRRPAPFGCSSTVWSLLLTGLLVVGPPGQGRASAASAAASASASPGYNFSFMVGDRANVSLTFRQSAVLDVSVEASDFLGAVELRSADRLIFTLAHRVVFHITGNTSFPLRTTVGLRGVYVGRSELRAFSLQEATGPGPGPGPGPGRAAAEEEEAEDRDEEEEQRGTGPGSTDRTALGSAAVSVYAPFRELGSAASVVLAVWLVVSYVTMAARVEPRVLLDKVRPPWGVLVGVLCQFVLMPPLAFALAKAFDLTGALAIGLILVGTCPGGFFSNIEVLLLDCDIVLSLTMTTLSTFLAVGMMPLNLFIYAQPFVGGEARLKTPFRSLMIQLCGLVLPLVVGVPFFYKFPKARRVCLKLVKPFSLVLMVLGTVLFLPSQYYVFFGDWKVWTTSAVLPLLGAFLGLSIARIANFDYAFSITVAIETGCQNTLLAVSVAKLFYEDPDSDIVATVPLLIAMLTGLEGLLLAGAYLLGRAACRSAKTDTVEAEAGAGAGAGAGAEAGAGAGDEGSLLRCSAEDGYRREEEEEIETTPSDLASEIDTPLAVISTPPGAGEEDLVSGGERRGATPRRPGTAAAPDDGHNDSSISPEHHDGRDGQTASTAPQSAANSRRGVALADDEAHSGHQNANNLYDSFVTHHHQVWL